MVKKLIKRAWRLKFKFLQFFCMTLAIDAKFVTNNIIKWIVIVGLITLCAFFDEIDEKQNEEYYKNADKKEKRLNLLVEIVIFVPIGCLIFLLLDQILGA